MTAPTPAATSDVRCPDCGRRGGSRRVVGVDGAVTHWHKICWFRFVCWLRGHDETCGTPNECSSKFREYLRREP